MVGTLTALDFGEHQDSHVDYHADNSVDKPVTKLEAANNERRKDVMNNMRTETWCGHDIRFVEINGEWWAILKDICDALCLNIFRVSQQLDPSMMERVSIEVSNASGDNITRSVLAINELGIYGALFSSKRLEARKFRRWSASVTQKLRSRVGLAGYEVMRMTDKDIQDDIDHILDTLFWDEEKKCLMQSVTVQGGDVEQIPFE